MTNRRKQALCCELCGRQQSPSRAWTLVALDKVRIGYYCTRGCAFGDRWGPRFRECEIAKYRKARR